MIPALLNVFLRLRLAGSCPRGGEKVSARELPQEEVTVSDSKPSDSGAVTPDLSLEEIKKTDVVEQIISEAEEKAFKENA